MPTRQDVEAAFASAQTCLLAYLDSLPPVQKPAPVLRFLDFPPWNVQEATLHVENTTGKPAQWVVFDDNAPKHTWRGDPQPVPADGVIKAKATQDGDKVKLLIPGTDLSVDSLPFKFAAPPDAPVVYPTGDTAVSRVNDFLAGLHGGDNIERNALWELSQEEHNYIREQVPMDCGRGFFPWRPQGGMGPNAYGQLASQDSVRAFVGGLVKARNAGYKRYFADCMDVLDGWAGMQVPGAVELCKRHIRMVCQEVKAQQLPPDFLCIGPVNEWAIDMRDVLLYQDVFLAIMRAELPQHILSSGPDHWKYWGKLIESQDYVPPKDTLSVVDVHSYKRMDAAGWKWLRGELDKWQQRTKRRIVYGECGCGSLGATPGSGDETKEDVWAEQMRLGLPEMRPFVPISWTICFGGHWRHNEGEQRARIKPHIATALRDALDL